ncbi:MAG: hypothetical protein COZ07_07365 [Candidatus Infernicultor aquiphilus]|uniref:DUF1223 domain-containing protein n=1 Tax=Candidatus Infernicultor aquiphilus TaxID=1805029 RepID=A0A2M7PNF0_9BACT|nr:MAG: hypothetical protein COZ07_07365 [Candidatus Atribacteria bacterium CG_4_10_14_3_um_filter_34_13]
MKEKLFIFIFLIIFLLVLPNGNILTSPVFAQDTASPKSVPRVVLVELFVREGCLSCPTAEFCLEDLAWEYGTTKVILVEEHLWGDGYDTTETNARYDWHVGSDKKGTPDVFINGLTKRLQGLACDCVEGNYTCYKKAIDEELTQPPLVELSAVKTPHPNPLPQGEKEEEKVLNIIIEGTVKNISDTFLKDLAVCGMVSKERDESGLYCYAQDIFPFQNIPLLLPDHTFNFKFTSEISLDQEDDREKEKLHFIVFVQNLETKKVLQSFYVE